MSASGGRPPRIKRVRDVRCISCQRYRPCVGRECVDQAECMAECAANENFRAMLRAFIDLTGRITCPPRKG